MISRRLGLYLAADLSLAAGVVHALLAPEHFAEGFEYGAFFALAAAAQLAYPALLLKWPEVGTLLAGAAGNAAILLLYFITRTSGIPYGPLAGEVEPVGLVDAASKLAEAGLIATLLMLAGAHLATTGPRRTTGPAMPSSPEE